MGLPSLRRRAWVIWRMGGKPLEGRIGIRRGFELGATTLKVEGSVPSHHHHREYTCLKGDPNLTGNRHYGHFGDRYSERLAHSTMGPEGVPIYVTGLNPKP